MTEQIDPLISIPAAARAIGIERTTLGKQVRAGTVRSHGRKVRLSEVIADRAAAVDQTRSRRRDGSPDHIAPGAPAPAAAKAGPASATPAVTPYLDARTRKEDATARLRQLEYDRATGDLVPIEDVARQVEREYAVVRTRLIGIPGKLRSVIGEEYAHAVEDEIHQALAELSDGAKIADKTKHAGGRR